MIYLYESEDGCYTSTKFFEDRTLLCKYLNYNELIKGLLDSVEVFQDEEDIEIIFPFMAKGQYDDCIGVDRRYYFGEEEYEMMTKHLLLYPPYDEFILKYNEALGEKVKEILH